MWQCESCHQFHHVYIECRCISLETLQKPPEDVPVDESILFAESRVLAFQDHCEADAQRSENIERELLEIGHQTRRLRELVHDLEERAECLQVEKEGYVLCVDT